MRPAELSAYLSRVGFQGEPAPTLATLRALILAHIQAIPFENLDVLLNRPIRLEPEALLQKLVYDQRGGYCFEQNGLFLEVLRTIGYEVRPLSARVRLQRARDFIPPRTHMFLRLDIEGESWLADVGVGGLSPTGPIRLVPEINQETPHESRRLIEWEGRLLHQALVGEEWADICEFTLEEMPLIDREVANWWTSTHPASHFRNRLLVARATPNGRLTLLNRQFTDRRPEAVRTEMVPSPPALLSLLQQQFGLLFPSETRFRCEGLQWED